jgi:hypothetical protein
MTNKRPLTPGPGQYTIMHHNSFGSGGPKFSVGKSQNNENVKFSNLNLSSTQNKSLIPGPGHYALDLSLFESTMKNPPKFKFGSASKSISNDNKIPGVGQYNVDKSVVIHKSPGWRYIIIIF